MKKEWGWLGVWQEKQMRRKGRRFNFRAVLLCHIVVASVISDGGWRETRKVLYSCRWLGLPMNGKASLWSSSWLLDSISEMRTESLARPPAHRVLRSFSSSNFLLLLSLWYSNPPISPFLPHSDFFVYILWWAQPLSFHIHLAVSIWDDKLNCNGNRSRRMRRQV